MPSALISLFLAATSLAAPAPDPYAPPPAAGTPERLAYDAMRGGPVQDAAIERWLAANPRAPLPVRAMLSHRLCLDYGRHTHGERWRAACAQSVALNPGLDDADLTAATILRDLPPLAASGRARITLSANAWGSKSAPVRVNGTTLPWLVDTGAGITALSESTAAKLGIKRLGGAVSVVTATSIKPTASFGVIDELAVGGARVRNVPVVILPDAALTSNGNTVPAILGLPVIVAFRAMAWREQGSLLELGPDAGKANRGQRSVAVYWHEDGIGLPIATAAGTAGIDLDTGAYATHLRSPIERLLSERQLAGLTSNDGLLTGAGGTEKVTASTLPRFDFTLADVPLTLTNLQVERNEGTSGWLGNDIWAQVESIRIDFATMTLVAKPVAGR